MCEVALLLPRASGNILKLTSPGSLKDSNFFFLIYIYVYLFVTWILVAGCEI